MKIFFYNYLFILLIYLNFNFFYGREENVPQFYKEIKLENIQFKVREWKSGRELGNFTIPSDNYQKYSKGLRLEEKLLIILQFNIIDKYSKELIEEIQQKFLRLWHSKSEEHEVFFIGKKLTKENKGKYFIEIAMPRDINKFKGRPGRYHCELIIGDIRIKNSFRWHLIDIFVNIPKNKNKKDEIYTSKNKSHKIGPLPELSHKFKKINWFSLILNLFFNLKLIQLLFLPFLIGSIFILYLFNWLKDEFKIINIFYFLPIFGIFSFFIGYFVLKNLAYKRQNIKILINEKENIEKIIKEEEEESEEFFDSI